MLPQQNILRLPVAPLKTLCDDTNKKALPAALRIHSIISSVLFESAGQETKMEHEPTRTSPQTMQGKGEKGTPAAICRLYKKMAKVKDTCRCLKTPQSWGGGKGCLHLSTDFTTSGAKKDSFDRAHTAPKQHKPCLQCITHSSKDPSVTQNRHQAHTPCTLATRASD